MRGLNLLALQTSPSSSSLPVVDAPGLDAVRAIVALVAVVLVLGAFLWLLKRGAFSMFGRGTRRDLAIETALPLGDRRSLVVVAVEGRRLLLGLTPSQVSLITELAQRPARFGEALDTALTPREGQGA